MDKPEPLPRVPETNTPFYWFKGKTLTELHRLLSEIGPDNARVECRERGEKMDLHVLKKTAAGWELVAVLNDSVLCPPIC